MVVRSVPGTDDVSVRRLLADYSIVTGPLAVGIALLGLGALFQIAGRPVEAGVAAATGLLICAIGGIIYIVFWALGRFGT